MCNLAQTLVIHFGDVDDVGTKVQKARMALDLVRQASTVSNPFSCIRCGLFRNGHLTSIVSFTTYVQPIVPRAEALRTMQESSWKKSLHIQSK